MAENENQTEENTGDEGSEITLPIDTAVSYD